MPSLFSSTAVDAAFNRIHNLQPDASPRWGSMNPATMLQHCRIITESMIRQRPAASTPTLRQRIMRTLILNGIIKIPHGRQMPKHIAEQMSAAGQAEFATEKAALLQALEAFAAFRGDLNGAHPRFGKMNRTQWGRFAWVHLDHHLRQFGV